MTRIAPLAWGPGDQVLVLGVVEASLVGSPRVVALARRPARNFDRYALVDDETQRVYPVAFAFSDAVTSRLVSPG